MNLSLIHIYVVMMGTMIENTSTQVENLNSAAVEMSNASASARDALEELNHINEKAIESIEVIYQQTHTTNESALKIKDVTELIASIAEETNLLSLNASILSLIHISVIGHECVLCCFKY